MTKYLLTMHMPSNQGFLVHQITIEHETSTLEEFGEALNAYEFVIGRLLYRRQNDQGIYVWLDKGEIVINTSHIGKAQLYIEFGGNDDDAYGNFENSNQHSKLGRGPVRPRR